MRRLTAAEFRKLFTTRLWLWILLASAAWTAGYTALAIGAGGAEPLAAILGAIGVTAEYRHRTAAATFLATPRRGRVIAAKLTTYLIAGAGLALACIAVSLAVALPWLASKDIHVPPAGNGNLAVLAAVVASAAIFGAAGAGLGALAGGQLATVTSILIYLYVAEPLISHISALQAWTPYLPGVAADGLTQATQAGVRLLAPWLGGAVFASWAAVLSTAGTIRTIRRDIT